MHYHHIKKTRRWEKLENLERKCRKKSNFLSIGKGFFPWPWLLCSRAFDLMPVPTNIVKALGRSSSGSSRHRNVNNQWNVKLCIMKWWILLGKTKLAMVMDIKPNIPSKSQVTRRQNVNKFAWRPFCLSFNWNCLCSTIIIINCFRFCHHLQIASFKRSAFKIKDCLKNHITI